RTEDPGSNMDLISAVVAQEGGHTYEGALAVISCMMNRADVGSWGGGDVISVIKAPGQFAAYLDGNYSKYMGAALPEVRQAVTDCMVGGKRSHNYLSFRSYQTSGSVQIAGGNWYFNEK
ncbi:cell wall hydrolase, partial [Eubacterium aggregans]|uniref:cell wall hydrolase n=1 Tax=Eubacterium aggregans TaxID=81409 RepID=UPI003F2DB54A